MLVLIDAYVRIVDKLVNFQSWQFMIKYGSDALAAKNHSGFKALVKLGTIVDSVTAVIGCAISIGLAGLIARWGGEASMRLVRLGGDPVLQDAGQQA